MIRQREPLNRSTKPIARRTRVKQKRATPRRRPEGTHDEAYKAAVRALPCYVCGKPAPSEPDHQGERGHGQKAPDDTCVPMCGGLEGCHRMRTDGNLPLGGTGYPRTWIPAGKAQMRAWCWHAIAATRKTLGYGERVGGAGGIDMETL